jgi:acetoin utilization protein AcuB
MARAGPKPRTIPEFLAGARILCAPGSGARIRCARRRDQELQTRRRKLAPRRGTVLEDTTRMQSSRRTVRDYMSPCVHTIGKGQTMATAHAMMRKWKIRHLPVLDAGRVVGLLSIRDLHLVETLSDVDPTKVPVEDAMSAEPYTIAPEADLRTVAVEMATRRLGSVLVVNRDKVVGIFTTVDALRALFELLDESDSAVNARTKQPVVQETRP